MSCSAELSMIFYSLGAWMPLLTISPGHRQSILFNTCVKVLELSLQIFPNMTRLTFVLNEVKWHHTGGAAGHISRSQTFA